MYLHALYMKDLFIAEATIAEGDIAEAPILGSFADCCKKWSYNRMIDLHWALKHIALKYI